MATPLDPSRDGGPPSDIETPAEDLALRDQMARVSDEKAYALKDPGTPWKEWWYLHASKWYIGLGLLIVDVWIVASWIEANSPLGLVLSLATALYLEFLLYQYLWHVPSPGDRRTRDRFRPSWFRPVEHGRWTPGSVRTGDRRGLPDPGDGPSPDEFL